MLQTAILATALFSSVLIGWFVVTRDPKQTLNQLFGLLTLSFISLAVFNHLTLEPSSNMLLYMRLVIVSTTIACATMLLLILEIRHNLKKKTPPALTYALAVSTCLVAGLEMTPLVFSGLSSGDSPTPIPAWGVSLFIIHFVVCMSASLAVLFGGARHSYSKERKRFIAMQVGIAPILILAPLTSVILPVFFHITSFVMFSPLYLVCFLASVGYAIVRHGLFDIKLAAVRTTAYALSLSTMALLYFFLAYFASLTAFKDDISTGISMSPINIALALVLAFIFQPVKQFFDRATDRIFYKDRYNIDEFIARLSRVLTTTTDLRNLLGRAAVEIGSTLKSEYAFFTVMYNHTHKVTAGTDSHPSFSNSELEEIRDATKRIDNGVVVVEALNEDDPLKKIFTHHKVSLFMILRLDGTAVGYFSLGEQRSSGYTNRDVKLLSTIADELIIAIQNSLSIQEVRDINIHLQQRIDAATEELRHSNSKLKELDKSKDEFISMASHQLRTPLTAVKGYVSMLLEGDIGKVSSQQREVLEQAYDSSQRMVFLIGDFLNVSRLQTGKFVLEPSSINFTKLVEEEVDQLKDTARARHITLNYEAPETAIVATADENKLRQVMMNFMDNAIFYSPSGKSVDVQLYRDAEGIVFRVNDHGIGVPKAEQSKLFTKFFRAGNAKQQRPDGTGIGIYMAKKVVLAHGGTLIFESTEGVGSTFGFKLPLKNDLNQLDK